MTYVFGSAFDPITIAHTKIIDHFCSLMDDEDEMILLVTNNDEKNYTEIGYRRVMMVYTWVMQSKYKNKIHIEVQNARLFEYVARHPGIFPEDSMYIIGSDEWEALLAGKWEHHVELQTYFKFIVVTRDSIPVQPPVIPGNSVIMVHLDIPANASSTSLRKMLYENPMYCVETDYYDGCLPCVVKKLIAERRWYWQNPATYYEDQEAFIKDYREVQIPKHHYPEPSNTVDNVAICRDRVLLIRRKNYPYKNFWCLPGGFFDKTDDCLECSAARELGEETGVHIDSSEFIQIRTYSHIFDPRLRIIDTAFLVEVEQELPVKGLDDAADAAWFPLDDLPKLGFHHEQIIKDAMKIHYTIK